MIKAVIFDLDGTLVDTIVDIGRTVEAIMLHYGIKSAYTENDYKKMVGNGPRALFEQALDGIDLNIEGEKVSAMFKDIYGKLLFDNSKPYDGIMELLDSLKKDKIKLAVLSNKPDVNAQQMVNHFFEKGTFDVVSGSCEGMPTKPAPAIVFKALKSMNLCADQAVFVGDSNTDIETAKNSKMLSIGVDWGFRGEKELIATGADFIAYESKDIMSIINNINEN